MKKTNLLDFIVSPRVTEKATSLSEQNKVVFQVRKDIEKKMIKKSVEKIFKVNVTKINTINIKGKSKMVRGRKEKPVR